MLNALFPASVVRLSALQRVDEGRVICTLIGLNALGCPVWTTTLTREC